MRSAARRRGACGGEIPPGLRQAAVEGGGVEKAGQQLGFGVATLQASHTLYIGQGGRPRGLPCPPKRWAAAKLPPMTRPI
jgi:hypothetical protein